MANEVRLAAYASIALATGPFLFFQGFRVLRTHRLIRNTPTARIRSMAMGLVEVTGSVHPRSTTAAPFSGRSCAFWQIEIQSKTGRHGWSTIHRNHSGNPFFLRDETGVALVYPKGADARFHGWGTDESCHGLNLPSFYADYMKQHLGWWRSLSRVGWLRFRERVIEEGQAVYVLGSAMPKPKVVSVSEGEALAATGTDDAFPIRRPTLDSEVAGVIRRGENEKTFVITEESELSLSAGLGWKAAAMIGGGPLLTLFGLGYWLMVVASGRWPW